MLADVVRDGGGRPGRDGDATAGPTGPVVAVVGRRHGRPGRRLGAGPARATAPPSPGSSCSRPAAGPAARCAPPSSAAATVDLAADAFLARRPEATGLCDELGLTDALVAPGATRCLAVGPGPAPHDARRGQPRRADPVRGPWSARGILGPAGLLRAAVDLVRPHRGDPGATGDRSVGDIVAARLGHEVVERLVDPLVGGIHAGGVDDLSAEATFPPLLAADRQSGSLDARPPSSAVAGPDLRRHPPNRVRPRRRSSGRSTGTTARLPAELAAALVARGVAVHTGVAVESLARLPARRARDRPGELALAGDAGRGARRHGGFGGLGPDPGRRRGGAGRARRSGRRAARRPRPAGRRHCSVRIEHSSVAVVTLSLPAGCHPEPPGRHRVPGPPHLARRRAVRPHHRCARTSPASGPAWPGPRTSSSACRSAARRQPAGLARRRRADGGRGRRAVRRPRRQRGPPASRWSPGGTGPSPSTRVGHLARASDHRAGRGRPARRGRGRSHLPGRRHPGRRGQRPDRGPCRPRGRSTAARRPVRADEPRARCGPRPR